MHEYQSRNSFQNKVACAHLIKRCTMMMMIMMMMMIIINSIPNPNLMNWDGVQPNCTMGLSSKDKFVPSFLQNFACTSSLSRKVSKVTAAQQCSHSGSGYEFFFIFFFCSVHKTIRVSASFFFLIFPLFIKISRGFVMQCRFALQTKLCLNSLSLFGDCLSLISVLFVGRVKWEMTGTTEQQVPPDLR